MINLYIYGMSHVLSIIKYITKENFILNHNDYAENIDRNLIFNHGIYSIEGINVNLFSSIFHPALLEEYGGIAYYNSNYQLIKNHNLLNILKENLEKYNINYSIGFINGNEHNVSTMTNNRFEVDFNLNEYPELNSNSGKEFVSKSLVQSQVEAWSRGTYAIYDSLFDVIPSNKFYSDPPPPVEHLNDIISIYNENFRDDAKLHGIVDSNIRMKIYILYINSLYNNNKLNYKNLKSPIMVNGPMYMPINFVQGVTHGNISYSQQVLNFFLKEI